MTKKLLVLGFALAAAFAASLPRAASAANCPGHVMVCGDISFCCPRGAICWC
jgi:hypothetical protein